MIMFPGITILMISASVVLFVSVLIAAVYTLNKQHKAPVVTARARFISKRRSRLASSNSISHKATFELEDKTIIELNMRYDDWYALQEGQEGTIKYKGIWMISFEA